MSNLSLDDYYNKDKKFGKFIENGAAYVIESGETPRPWLQFLCNDKIFSCVSNVGGGFIRHIKGCNLTKEWSQYYLIREPYAVGNVYYGPNNSRFGMNLFSRFTATPSWLIHGGFKAILGVKA